MGQHACIGCSEQARIVQPVQLSLGHLEDLLRLEVQMTNYHSDAGRFVVIPERGLKNLDYIKVGFFSTVHH